ncbi:hypothetical protein GIW70_11405 [Pseudomonas syringae]|nr:hypothetical protein [Pseudomonas syringae]MCF5068791.1 hypothetical protein [Pseudomonas syringae]
MIRGRPDIETPVLLANARDNLTSLNCICERFAEELEGDSRKKALAIHQLTVLAEMLISRALESLDPTQPPALAAPAVVH